MLVESTYTGRLPSLPSRNRCVGLKLRSTVLCWFRLSEYVRLSDVENRLRSVAPLQPTLERTLRDATKSGEKAVTFGTTFANGVFAPPTHCVGMSDGSETYAFQFGTGVAVPTQVTCCTALGSPVLSSAEPISPVPGTFCNTPTPPRTTARGPRTA